MWLRVSRNGQTVYSWGEKPEEGLGLAPHEKSPAAAIVPIPDLRAGDAIQVLAPTICKSGQAKVRIRRVVEVPLGGDVHRNYARASRTPSQSARIQKKVRRSLSSKREADGHCC